jgi:hypothetical protein
MFGTGLKEVLISIFYVKIKCLYEAYIQDGFICKALVTEVIIIFEKIDVHDFYFRLE